MEHTAKQLKTIKNWPFEDGFFYLMQYVFDLWWASEWGWKEEKCTDRVAYKFEISTGGWSGNEDLIDALSENTMFWSLCWEQSRRGGHYIFEVPPTKR